MAQSLKHDILENKPYVDLVIGPDSYRRLPEILEGIKNLQDLGFENIKIIWFKSRVGRRGVIFF